MRDFYPKEKAMYNWFYEVFKKVTKRYNFQEVEAPAIENIGLLTMKSGDEIKKQLFTIEKKGSEELGLRFDLTVSLTRMFAQKQRELAKPVKWYAISRMWRYERPQKGRLREFYQFGVEIFGVTSKQPMLKLFHWELTVSRLLV